MQQAKAGVTTTTTNSYNKRQQAVWVSAATSSTSLLSLCYDFHSAYAISSTPCSFPSYATGNNGNVFQIVNNRDGNRTKNFMYDSLNRIQQAYTNGPNWGETFGPIATAPGVAPASSGIDAWGNLTNRSGSDRQNRLRAAERLCHYTEPPGSWITDGPPRLRHPHLGHAECPLDRMA
jgi:hypothetical protein